MSMIKKIIFSLWLVTVPLQIASAHKYDKYVDASEGVPIILHSIDNKRNERLTQTSPQNIEVSTGKLILGNKGIGLIADEIFKTVAKKADVNIKLSELKDYFLKVPSDNTKVLRLTYHLVDGQHLYIHLMRYLVGPNVTRPELKEIFINLAQLVANKKKELEAIKLEIVVDGPKMENSSVEAIPVFKEDSRPTQATPAHPA